MGYGGLGQGDYDNPDPQKHIHVYSSGGFLRIIHS